MPVFNFGSINIDYVYRVSSFVQPGETLPSLSLGTVLGGKGANQSVALAKAGAQAVHLGRVSSSDAWAVNAMNEFGVDTSVIEMIDEPSGHAIIQVDDAGENAIVLHGGANQSFNKDAVASMLKDAKESDWLLLQNECNALDVAMDIAAQKKMNIAFNPAPMTESVLSLPLSACALLIVNEVEAEQLTGVSTAAEVSDNSVAGVNSELIDQLEKQFPDTTVVITLGSKGAVMLSGGERHVANALAVDTVDTTGAGDTFVGFMLAAMVSGGSCEDALQQACVAGALAVTKAGATPSIPDLASVKLALKENN